MADKPGKPETEEPKVKVTQEEPKESTVEVPTSEKKEPDHITKSDLDALTARLEKSERRNEYLNRQLQKKLNQSQAQVPLSQPHHSNGKSDDITKLSADDINQIAEQDWQKAVDIKAELKARELLERQRSEYAQQENQLRISQQVESSRQKVRDRYPNIENESSNENKFFIQAMNENPDFINNPRGPELTMYRMEELMRESGVSPEPIKQSILSKANEEVQRRMRAASGSTPYGRPVNSDTVTLTTSEVEMAKKAGIPLSEYAKYYKMGEKDFREGVSVDES